MSPDPPRDQSLFDPQPPTPAYTPPSTSPPLTPPVDDSPLRRFLPWTISAAAVLGLMLVMLLVVLPRVSQVPRPARNPPLPSSSAAVLPPVEPAALPTSVPAAVPVQPPVAAQAPLSVTLYSAGGGKHVPVGKPVLISAYAVLPPAGSATIAIAYTRNGGPRSLLTLAQGSLSTASWTPTAPGRYDFTASASDSRKISVFSHHLTIDADAPRVAVKPLPVAPPPVEAAPIRAASVRPVRLKQPAPKRIAVRPVPPKRPAPKTVTAEQAILPKASRPKAYHVAAAVFVARPLAETLAGALRRRGFHASVHPGPGLFHKRNYVVQTGDYLRPADAQKQAETLKHDGYPAYVFQMH